MLTISTQNHPRKLNLNAFYPLKTSTSVSTQYQVYCLVYLSVPLKVLSDSNGLLNQMVEILREIRGKAFGLQDSQAFISSHKTDLCHTM